MTWSLFWCVSILGLFLLFISAITTIEIELEEVLRDRIDADHVRLRLMHHVQILHMSGQIYVKINDWMEHLSLKSPINRSRIDKEYGQNLWYMENFKFIPMFYDERYNPVYSWYSEMKFYPKEPMEKWRQFTQLIWKGSTYYACKSKGVRTANEALETGSVLVICLYHPPGNEGSFHENVFTVDGEPWTNDSLKKVDGTPWKNDSLKKVDGAPRKNDSLKDGSFGSKDCGELSKSYCIYGLMFVTPLLVIFLVIFIYKQIFSDKQEEGEDEEVELEFSDK